MKISDLNLRDNYSLKKSDVLNYGLTNTLMNIYLECPMKFYLSLNGVKMKGCEISNTKFGSKVHLGLEEFYKTKKINFLSFQRMLANETPSINLDLFGRIIGTLKAYISYYSSDFDKYEVIDTEYVFEKLILGVPVRGVIDSSLKSKKTGVMYMNDHKTRADLNKDSVNMLLQYLRFDQQTQLYLLSDKHNCSKMIYNLIKNKSRNRIKIKETVVEFSKRIEQDMLANPDDNFQRIVLELNENDFDFFLDTIKKRISKIKAFIKKSENKIDLSCRNHNSCQGKFGYSCQFLPICAYNNIDTDMYSIGNVVSNELERFNNETHKKLKI